jgi:hypothetical protein
MDLNSFGSDIEGAESAVLKVERASSNAAAIANYWDKIQLSELIVLASADSIREIVEVIFLNR